MYRYSIIIAHKNLLSLLGRCLDSIPQRSDIQVIVIDDNSDILEGDWEVFRKEYYYVDLVFTKESRGAGYARNIGVARAQGKWIVIADADDFFHDGAFDKLDEYAESDNDIIYFYADTVDSDTLQKVKDRWTYE